MKTWKDDHQQEWKTPTIILAIVVNIIMTVFYAGKISERVDTTSAAVVRLEDRFNHFTERAGKP